MKKMFIHIGVWVGIAYILFISLSILVDWDQALLRALAGTSLMALVFYFSGWVLTNQFLINQKKPLLYIVFSLFTVFFLSIFRVRIMSLFPIEFGPFINLPEDAQVVRSNLLQERGMMIINRLGVGRTTYFMSFFMNAIILVIATLCRLYENKAQKERESRDQLQQAQEAQIVYLKSQVNPHFLFNTLNNLYGLTYSKSDLAPKMVLGLSDTMRYLIYETEQKLVPIEKELSFIQNYLELEKMRISNPEDIRVSIHVNKPSLFIPPLFLLPFVENCFKHGAIGKDDEGWVEIDIWDEDENFFFVCKNRYNENSKSKSPSGMGLENVRKRLDLLYEDKYELKNLRLHDEYMVSLQFPVFKSKEMV